MTTGPIWQNVRSATLSRTAAKQSRCTRWARSSPVFQRSTLESLVRKSRFRVQCTASARERKVAPSTSNGRSTPQLSDRHLRKSRTGQGISQKPPNTPAGATSSSQSPHTRAADVKYRFRGLPIRSLGPGGCRNVVLKGFPSLSESENPSESSPDVGYCMCSKLEK